MTDKELIATIRQRTEEARHAAMCAAQQAKFGPPTGQPGELEYGMESTKLHEAADRAKVRHCFWLMVTNETYNTPVEVKERYKESWYI